TIVRIRFTKQSVKEDSGLISVWAVGTYPVGNEECMIELTLFVPIDNEERDSDTHAIFEKEELYLVGGKIVPGKYKDDVRPKMIVSSSTHLKIVVKDPLYNKCPLKVSLVGIPQGLPAEIDKDTNAVFEMLINDYGIRDNKFVVKIIYLYLKSRFNYIKNIIRPQESIIFVVGIMEIIEGNFYIYANEISNVDIPSISVGDTSGSNIKMHSDDLADKYQYEVLSDDSYSSKRKRNKGTDNDVKDLEEIRSFEQDNFTEDEREELLLDDNKNEEKSRSYKK
ncbi:11828_t:CDS:2, partial [Cetraspora pellucida]